MRRCIISEETNSVEFEILKKILAHTGFAAGESELRYIVHNPFYTNPVVQIIRVLYNMISFALTGISVQITSSRICDQAMKLICDTNFISEQIIQQDCLCCVPFYDDCSTNTALRACFKARIGCQSQYRLQIYWILLLEAIARFSNLNNESYRYDIVRLTDILLYANDSEIIQLLASFAQISMSTGGKTPKLEAGNE